MSWQSGLLTWRKSSEACSGRWAPIARSAAPVHASLGLLDCLMTGCSRLLQCHQRAV